MRNIRKILLAILTFVLFIIVGLYWNRFIPDPYPVWESTKVLVTIMLLAPTFLLGLITDKWYYLLAPLLANLIVQVILEPERETHIIVGVFAFIYWGIFLVTAFLSGILFRIFIEEIWNR